MDGTLAIEGTSEALRRFLVTLVTMAGVGQTTLPRRLKNAVLKLLRPAESATRRLIIALAAAMPSIPAKSPRRRPTRQHIPAALILYDRLGTGVWLPPNLRGAKLLPVAAAAKAMPAVSAVRVPLPLLDRLYAPVRHPGRPATLPCVSHANTSERGIVVRLAPTPTDPINAARLRLRLEALKSALDDLPRQATRFARWRAPGGFARRHARRPTGRRGGTRESAVAAAARASAGFLRAVARSGAGGSHPRRCAGAICAGTPRQFVTAAPSCAAGDNLG